MKRRLALLSLFVLGCAGDTAPLEPGAYLAAGEAMLGTGAGQRSRSEEIGVFVDASGAPSHVFDARWQELHAVSFPDGSDLSEDVCSAAGCDWFVHRRSGCIHITYDEHFRPGRYDDTGHSWTGSMEVCPGDDPYVRALSVKTERGTPWLLPGDALIVEANYPLDPAEDVFEVSVDGLTMLPTPVTVGDDAHWRLEVTTAALTSLDVRMVGSRALTPERIPSPVPTTATIEDWTLASAPPEGSYAGLEMTYGDGALTGTTPGPVFRPVHAVFALGPVDASALRADLTITEGVPAFYTHVYTVRADGSEGATVERTTDPIPVASGTGGVWLVVEHDSLGHPFASRVGLRFGGVTAE